MPKVSIVVPVYNVERYLRQCLESLVRQTMKDIEILCVNDGSTDGSGAILREYAERDDRVTVIEQANGGYGRAMNAGIEKARGGYLGIVEPDDFVALTMYEDLYALAERHALDLVKADFYRFVTSEADETITFRYMHLSPRREDYGRVFCPREKKESFFYVMNTWTGIYRLDFLRAHGIRHQETPGAAYQDNGFWFQTFLYAKRAMIADFAGYRVRRDNPNSSVNNPGRAYAMNREYDYIRGILEKDGQTWEEMEDVYWRQRIRNYGATLNRIDAGLRETYLRTVRTEMETGISAGEFAPETFPPEERRLAEGLLRGEYIPLPAPTDELTRLKQSRSYRIGRAVTWLPEKVRDVIRGARDQESCTR